MTIHPALLRLSAIPPIGWMIRAFRRRQLAEQEATTDSLTGLANRRHFLRMADRVLSAAACRSQCCAILLIDLDRFKPVNDSFGHAAGDAVLVAVAQRLGQALPVAHAAGRLGGDEFVVLLGPAPDLKIALCAEQLAHRIGRPIAFAGQDIRVGVSIGIAVAPEDGRGATALLAAADERMDQRKRSRRRGPIASAA